jgi:hypothetical protein
VDLVLKRLDILASKMLHSSFIWRVCNDIPKISLLAAEVLVGHSLVGSSNAQDGWWLMIIHNIDHFVIVPLSCEQWIVLSVD